MPRNNLRSHARAFLAMGMALAAACPVPAREAAPAELSVSGLGFFGNRNQRLALERILGDERGAVMGANAVEDAVFMIVSSLADEGFLRPKVQTRLTQADGSVTTFDFDETLTTLLPRTLEIKAARFTVERGVRSVVNKVSFSGLTVMKEPEALGYFRPGEVPLVSAEARAYSPSRLRSSADNLQEALRQQGYLEASVRAEVSAEDRRSGRVDVAVTVSEGARWMVTEVVIEGPADVEVNTAGALARTGIPWWTGWQQDTMEIVRRAYYSQGYADVRIRVEGRPAQAEAGVRAVTAAVIVTPGIRVEVGEVSFEGNDHTLSLIHI